MKFDPLIEYNTKKFFLEKSYTNIKNVVKLVQGPFIKNWNWTYLRINSLKRYKISLYCVPKSKSTKITNINIANIKTKALTNWSNFM